MQRNWLAATACGIIRVERAAELDPRAVEGGTIVEYEVVIPDEVHAVLEWQQDDLPAVGGVNRSLAAFEPRIVFARHLSIIVECADLAENGMPAKGEASVLDRFGDDLDENLKADGNALFLARITWNGTRQFLYRVYDPEVANRCLTDLIEEDASPREFDFRMEHDETWLNAQYFLSHWNT